MKVFISLLLSLLPLATAQFGFFEQMFGGQEGHGHGHQQPRNNPSDANNYRTQVEQCKRLLLFSPICLPHCKKQRKLMLEPL